MAQSGVVFSLMDHALAELVNQLENRKFSEVEYVDGITRCASFISEKVPILPGKAQLAMWCKEQPNPRELEADNAYRQAVWRLLRFSTRLKHFKKGTTYQESPGKKREITMHPKEAERTLDLERKKWIKHIQKYRPGWEKQKLDERLRILAGGLNDEIDCTPPLTVRLDAALRHEDEVIRLRENVANPLNPESKKRRNDGIDFNMSFVFMKRILLCSAEEKYTDVVRRLGSYQSSWIYRPNELVDEWKAGGLERPAWPSS